VFEWRAGNGGMVFSDSGGSVTHWGVSMLPPHDLQSSPGQTVKTRFRVLKPSAKWRSFLFLFPFSGPKGSLLF
jgi:hypothetical protein